MPEVGRRDFERQTVGEVFARAKEALLPEEMAKSPLAQWVMSFDALSKDDIREDREAEYERPRGTDRNWRREAVEALSEGLLQGRIPFFFASLFHIGRLWKLTEASLDECMIVSNEGNLSTAVRSLTEEARQQNVPLDEQSAYQSLNELLSVGIQRHQSNLTLAQSWWGLWQSEVSEYQRAFNRMRERASDPSNGGWWEPMITLVLLSGKPSALHSTMVEKGVKFKSELGSLSQQPPFAYPLLIVSVLSSLANDYGRYHIDDIVSSILRQMRMAPNVQHALEHLQDKYGSTNPFLQYGAGLKAPDSTLSALIREHTLMNREHTWWLDEWMRSLESEHLYPRYNFPKKEAKPYDEVLNWSVTSADSVIKHRLVRPWRRQQPVESWREFLQRLFEEEWLHNVRQMMDYANSARLVSPLYSRSS